MVVGSQMNKSLKKTKLDHIVDGVSAALQSAPFCGGLAKYIEEYYPSQQKRIVKHILNELTEQAIKIEVVKCDLDELAARLNQTLINSLQTSSNIKREALRSILLNFAEGKQSSNHTIDLFTTLTLSLTELEILMLKVAENAQDIALEKYGPTYCVSTHPDVTVDEFIDGSSRDLNYVAYKRLVEFELIDMPYANLPGIQTPVYIRALKLSNLGRSFLEWITWHKE